MDEEEQEEVQNREIQEQSQNQNLPQGPIRGIGNKIRGGGKKLGKNAGGIFKEGIKGIWKALPPTAKLWTAGIIVALIFIAACVMVIADQGAQTAVTTNDDYFAAQTTATKGGTSYKETGSLLLASQKEIKEMAQILYSELENSAENLARDLKKKVSGGDNSNSDIKIKSGAIVVKDTRPLYEHILNAEKYNFNRILWRQYDRGVMITGSDGKPKQMEMEVDTESELQYPKDPGNMDLDKAISMTRPYLQSWLIPFCLMNGILQNSDIVDTDAAQNAGQLAYQTIAEGYHKITIDKYNMKKLTKTKVQNIYDEKVERTTITNTCPESGDMGPSPCVVTKTTEVLSEKLCKPDKAVETTSNETIVKYLPDSYLTFDGYIKFSYRYEEYDENGNPDDKSVTRTAYNIEPSEADKTPETPTNTEGTEIATKQYTTKRGYTEVTTNVYRDKIEQEKFEKREYTEYDVEEYLNPEILDSEDTQYYKGISEEKKINRFDIINSKPEIFKKYVPNDIQYSKNIGYHKDYMIYGYYTLSNKLIDLQEKYNGKSIAYGKSLDVIEMDNALIQNNTISSGEDGSVDYASLPAGGFGWPVPDSHSVTTGGIKSYPGHTGIDIKSINNSAPLFGAGPAVVAAQAGKVTKAVDGRTGFARGGDTGYGNYVYIEHAGGYVTRYAHMYPNSLKVKVGDEVVAGQQIGTMGGIGYCDPAGWVHSHFEIRKNGVIQDPLKYYKMVDGKYVSKLSEEAETSSLKQVKSAEIGNVELSSLEVDSLEDKSSLEESAGNLNTNETEAYRNYVNNTKITNWTDKYVINAPKYRQADSNMNPPTMPARGGTSVSGSGCGPTAISMVITGLTGERKWGPWEIFDWVVSSGNMVSGGSNNDIPKKFIEAKYSGVLSVKGQNIGKTGEDTKKNIIAALKNNSAIILLVGSNNYAFAGYSYSTKYYSGKGHFIALTGIKDGTDDEQVYTHDSGFRSDSYDKAHPLDSIIKVIQNTQYYIISKSDGSAASVDPNAQSSGPEDSGTSTEGKNITYGYDVPEATTTGRCQDFNPINWASYSNTGITETSTSSQANDVVIDADETNKGNVTYTDPSYYNSDGTPKSDREIMALVVYGEGSIDVDTGMEAIANVILNRAKEKNASILNVVKNPAQFNATNSSGTGLKTSLAPPNKNSSALKRVYAAVDKVLSPDRVDNTKGGMFYFVPDRSMSTAKWSWSRPITIEAGFYKAGKSYQYGYNMKQSEVTSLGCISAFHRFHT